MSPSWQLLALPLAESVLMGLLAGLVGALVLLDRRVFLTESLTHATFPGAVVGVVLASWVGQVLGRPVGYGALSVVVVAGAVIMCLPMVALVRWLSGLPGVSGQAAAGIVLSVGFALGYFLAAWFAPLPLKVDSFLTGSVLHANGLDVALTATVLAAALVVVAVGGRYLTFHAFDAIGYRAAGLSPRAAQMTVLVLICLTIGALVPAVGTILPIALIAAPAASLTHWCSTPRGLLAASASLGALTCALGTLAAAWAGLSVGGVIAVACGAVYLCSRSAQALAGARPQIPRTPRRSALMASRRSAAVRRATSTGSSAATGTTTSQ